MESFLARSDRKHYWRVIFGVVITWYLHIYVVERDRAALNLPQYELRDEQPELNQDSRVVRKRAPEWRDEVVHTNKFDDSEESEEIQAPEDFYPTPVYDETSIQLYRLTHRKTRDSISSLRSTRRSPKMCFQCMVWGTFKARKNNSRRGINSS